MAIIDKTQEQLTVWPLPKFFFMVKIGDFEGKFQEVSGLDEQGQQIEYRHNDSAVFSPVKMPGIKKYGNISLKKGVFKNDKAIWDLYALSKLDKVEKLTVIISLIDESNETVMTWTLNNAFPAKITVTDMKSDGKTAVESIELMYEGLSIAVT